MYKKLNKFTMNMFEHNLFLITISSQNDKVQLSYLEQIRYILISMENRKLHSKFIKKCYLNKKIK